MIHPIVNHYLGLGNFPIAWNYHKHYKQSSNRLLTETKLLFGQGLYKDALKLLQKTKPKNDESYRDSSLPTDVYYCYIYQILIESFILNTPHIGYQEALSLYDLHEDLSFSAKGFTCKTLAKILFFGIDFQLIEQDKFRLGLNYLEDSLKYYYEVRDDQEYFRTKILYYERVHKYLKNNRKEVIDELSFLQKEVHSKSLFHIEAQTILSILRLTHSTSSESQIETQFSRLTQINRQMHYIVGQGYFFLQKGEIIFQNGGDGRPIIEKAIYIFQKSAAYKDLLNAWKAYSLQSIHFSDLKNAQNSYQKALQLSRRMGIKSSQAIAMVGLGESLHRIGQFSQAIAYYEMAEELIKDTALVPLFGMNLANIYDQMNLKAKAVYLAETTVDRMKNQAINANHLSIAYYTLGNILVSTRNWEKAKKYWLEGLAFDKKHMLHKGIAEKSVSLAWTIIQEIYAQSKIVSKEQVDAIQPYYFDALTEIKKAELSQETIVTEAQIYQTFANIALFANDYESAFSQLNTAFEFYERHHLNMQAANTMALKGLIAYKLGLQIDIKYWESAINSYEKALAYFEQEKMKSFTWRINYYLADIALVIGTLQRDHNEQQRLWQEAEMYLYRSSIDIQYIRKEFQQKNIIEEDVGKLSLIIDKSKVYTLAIHLSLQYLKQTEKAFYWLEQLKSKSLMDLLEKSDSFVKNTVLDHPVNTKMEDKKYNSVSLKQLKRLLS